MLSIEQYNEIARDSVKFAAEDFHIEAVTTDGAKLLVPSTYQIAEPGFRPFRAGKASPMELQDGFDNIVKVATLRGVDLGLENEEAVRKLMIQEGLGIDCSNFALRALDRLHRTLRLFDYMDNIFSPAEEVRHSYEVKDSWIPQDARGRVYMPGEDITEKLASSDWLSIAWIAGAFGKDEAFITGSKHLVNDKSATRITSGEVMAGDVLAMQKAEGDTVCHVAVLEDVEHGADSVLVDFWHSWHTRDFSAGLRRDSVNVDLASGQAEWSHPGLADKTRYSGHFFARPILLKQLTDSIS